MVPEASTFPAGMHLLVGSVASTIPVGFWENMRWKPWPDNSTNVAFVQPEQIYANEPNRTQIET